MYVALSFAMFSAGFGKFEVPSVFSLVDCDEIHGEENVAASQVDDFTVETSLEDLEFRFSVIKNTQKVYYTRLRERDYNW